ncbi:hypothetical protein [Streptomyces djakartensis]|uniref:Uncharacterized protein n=1 Tax=Streptomyces djakartensis TaxID=68193 RepID=A0ABQ3A6V9_9ACTN|nr:hypothetical protein [Streptomyces djakartensis]GGY37772.1 hypothetical protein GCM10010384_51110 [Streptomyces djakartensis]
MKARVMSSLALPAALATAGLLNTAEAAYAAALGPDTPAASPYTHQGQQIGGDVTLTSGDGHPCTPIGNVTVTDYGHCCTPVGNITVTDYGHCCTPVGNITVTDYGHCCTPVGNVTICDYGHHQENGHHRPDHVPGRPLLHS